MAPKHPRVAQAANVVQTGIDILNRNPLRHFTPINLFSPQGTVDLAQMYARGEKPGWKDYGMALLDWM